MKSTTDLCDLCGGELKTDQTKLELWRGEELLVIRDVPADVCRQCHEAYLLASTSEQLDRFLIEPERYPPERYLAVAQ